MEDYGLHEMIECHMCHMSLYPLYRLLCDYPETIDIIKAQKTPDRAYTAFRKACFELGIESRCYPFIKCRKAKKMVTEYWHEITGS